MAWHYPKAGVLLPNPVDPNAGVDEPNAGVVDPKAGELAPNPPMVLPPKGFEVVGDAPKVDVLVLPKGDEPKPGVPAAPPVLPFTPACTSAIPSKTPKP